MFVSRRFAGSALAVLGLLSLTPAFSACTATVGVSDYYSALDSEGLRRRNEFFTDTAEIHCIAEYAAGRNDYTLTTQLRQIQDVTGAPLNLLHTSSESAEGPTENAKFDTRFFPTVNGQPAQGAPFPAGRYQCELLLDGELERTAVFNVRFAPCPTTVVNAQQDCAGFYAGGISCPGISPTGAPATCTCDPGPKWTCQ